MARNNTNRPRNNNSRSRNLSSFIPQPRVSITEREDIPRSTNFYIDSHPWTDYVSSANFSILDMSSTAPVQSVPNTDFIDRMNDQAIVENSGSLGATQISLDNGFTFWVSSEEWESHRRMMNESIERLARSYTNHRPRITEESGLLSNISPETRQLARDMWNNINSEPMTPEQSYEREEPIIYGERFDNIIIIGRTSALRVLNGWGNGYVILESGNLLIENSNSGQWREDYSLLDVYGGITYTSAIDESLVESRFGQSLYLTEEDIGKFLIGFDTSHFNSRELFPDRESVLEETIKLALQCAAY